MRVYPNIKPIHDKCKVIRCRSRIMVVYENPRREQRQDQSCSEMQKPEPMASGCNPNQVRRLISRRVKPVATLGIEGRGRESGG